MQIIENLEARKKYLEELIEVLSAKLSERISVGNIYTKNHKKGFQYYIKTDEGIKYVKSSERKLVQDAVQYEYDSKVFRAARENIKS